MKYKKQVRRINTDERNYSDPQYVKFRREVLKRDGYCCQWPKCGEKSRLRVHHIRKWADYPKLRFELSNGIALCRACHDRVWNEEEIWAKMFYTIIHQQTKGKKDEPSRRDSKKGAAKKVPRKKRPEGFAAKYAAAKKKARNKRGRR